MGLRFPQKVFGQCFFVTTTFEDWNRFGEVKDVFEGIADSLKFSLDKYNAKLLAYVLMTSHLHLVIVIDGKNVGNFMRDFKKYVSQKVMKDCGIKETNIWMPRYEGVYRILCKRPVHVS